MIPQMTKLNKDSREFVANIINTNKSKSLEFSISLAKVISSNISLPAGEVDDLLMDFKLNHQMNINFTLSDINELFPIEYDFISDLIVSFYSLRYNSAYPTNNILAVNEKTAVEDFFSIRRDVDDVILDCVRKNFLSITKYINKLTPVVEAMKKPVDWGAVSKL